MIRTEAILFLALLTQHSCRYLVAIGPRSRTLICLRLTFSHNLSRLHSMAQSVALWILLLQLFIKQLYVLRTTVLMEILKIFLRTEAMVTVWSIDLVESHYFVFIHQLSLSRTCLLLLTIVNMRFPAIVNQFIILLRKCTIFISYTKFVI